MKKETYPNPLAIRFGEGRILVSVFNDEDGVGVLLTDTGKPHEIGERTAEPGEKEHKPEAGEIYLKFTRLESLRVVSDKLDEARIQLQRKQSGLPLLDLIT